MKNLIVLLSTTLLLACNNSNTTAVKEVKTAYIDTSKLMGESAEAKNIEAKYKKKSAEMGSKLEAEEKKLRTEAENFKRNAMKNGEAWAQQKGAELQQRDQQLQYAQQAMVQQLQSESNQEMDSLVVKYKKTIKALGIEKGYDYIYGTGEQASILFAKDNYDLTKEVIKKINEAYIKGNNKDEKPAKAKKSK